MHEDDGSAAPESPPTPISVAERWRLLALDTLERWTPGQRWLQFAAAVEERHLAAFMRSTPQRSDQRYALLPSAQGLAHAPTRFGLGGEMPTGATGAAADISRTSADAAARADRSERVARRSPSWPTTDAGPSAPEPAFRSAAWPRSIAPGAQGGGAGARAGDGAIDPRLAAGALHGLARTLDPYVQGYLSRLLDLRIPAVRIHTGQAADATARRFNADAVSFGPHIMFRAGRFAPDSASGLGLLGHELTHVAQTESDRSARPLERAALAREELAALENEERVLRHLAGKPVMTAQLPVVLPQPTSRALSGTPAPRTASVDRGVAPSAVDSGAASPPPELSAQQLGALKEAIYRDLLDRIRTEFERGA